LENSLTLFPSEPGTGMTCLTYVVKALKEEASLANVPEEKKLFG